MPKKINVHALARKELKKALAWYLARDLHAADRFQAALDQGTAAILDHPERWPIYLLGARYYQLKKFPFLLVYRVKVEQIELLAVAHTSRRPGYWRRRKFIE